MEVNIKIKKGLRIRAFQLFFIMLGIQIGVGILGAPRYIFEKAHQDAWVSVLIAFVYMLIVLWTMFLILSQYENADIYGIQVDVFGKWFGKFLGTIYLLFFVAELLSVLLSYVEVIQVFIYPTITPFFMALLLLMLIVYSVLGGIRVVVGIVFLFVLLSLWVLVLLYDPITRMEIAHFQPMFEASIPDLLKGAKTTAYTFLGLEILFVIYPFIDNKKNAKLPTYLGASASAFLVFIATVISIGYFSPYDFDLMNWPVLSLFKSVSFSFMERFDYYVVVEWMMIVIPTMVLLMWAITYGTKRLYAIPQKTTLYVVAILLLLISSFINQAYKIEKITDFIAEVGFWIIFVYPIVLLPIVLVKKNRQRSKGSAK